MIGEAIYIRVSDRKYNPIATKCGNVPTRVGAANPLFSLWRALWRPTAPASRTKSRRTAEESRTMWPYVIVNTRCKHGNMGRFLYILTSHYW